ncbi:MAG: RES domain-containing protein [Thermodesulfobacteriota bacterium]
MGKEQTKLTEDYEQRFTPPEKYVCADCVEDRFLKGVISINLAQRKCDYCGKGSEENIAASVEAIMEPIASTLFRLFDYHSEERNLDELLTTAYALRKIPLKCHEDLFKDVATAFWWNKWHEDPDSFYDPGNSMRYSWGRFVRDVKHHVRFFFSSVESKYKFSFEKPPVKLFEEIGQIVSAQKLIKPLKAETVLFRVRIREDNATWPLNDKELGPPPNEKARSQRMNPAGISYLYLARERETALAEVLSKPPCQAVVGCFKVRRDLRILDLIALPDMPSIFDNERYHESELMDFLNDFVREISKPVQKDEKDGAEHLDYVPSQVVCEYFANIFKSEDGKSIDGLEYPSSIRQEGRNIVLFPPQKREDCFGDLVCLSGAEEIEFQTWSELCAAIQTKSGDL